MNALARCLARDCFQVLFSLTTIFLRCDLACNIDAPCTASHDPSTLHASLPSAHTTGMQTDRPMASISRPGLAMAAQVGLQFSLWLVTL
jgi:hypothetical protein